MTTSKETLEEIIQAQIFQAGAWRKVIDCSRQYAMMAATGSYMENGNRITTRFNDRADMENMFSENLLRAARDAFIEDALVGAALQNVK